jgi:DNA invertase Pin-like site-specific DNA recombinase
VDALIQADLLLKRGIGFEIATLQIDMATPEGMLVYTVMAAFAEFERRILIQRTKQGLAATRRRGKRLGRPPKFSLEQLEDARRRVAASDTVSSIAREIGVRPWTLTRALRRQEKLNHVHKAQ